jgi:hypothetical protein
VPKRDIPSNLLRPTNKPVDKWFSLVRMPPPLSMDNENERVHEIEKRDGPKGSRTPDPRHVKAVS